MLSSLSSTRLKKYFTFIICLIILSTFLFIHHTTNQFYQNQLLNNTPNSNNNNNNNVAILKYFQRLQQINIDTIRWMKHLNLTDLYYNRLPQIEKNIFSDTENIIITAADHIDNDYDDNDNLMLTKFNLSDIDGFDSKNNFKDRILLFHLRLINRIDTYIYADQPITDVENEIEHRRSKGMKTNLKKSEFKVITKIILGARLCDPLEYGANLSVVIFVVTKPDDFHLRSLIRSTWASKFQSNSNTSRLYFVFGRIMRQKLFDFRKIDEMIRQENDHFNDIIQWNYSEDYFRLTIKSMAIVRWASIYCPLAVNVFKVDADALINYDNFIEFCQKLKQNYQYNQQNNNAARFAIYGNLWNNTAVIRLQKNKFFTSFHDFPKKFYPLYTGSAWLMNGRSSCLFIYLAAIQQSMPALLWEDIYITGIVPEKLEKISKIPFKRYQMPGFQFNVKPKHIDQCIYNRSIIFTEQMKETNLQSIWNHVNNNSVEQTITDSNHTPLSCKFQLNL